MAATSSAGLPLIALSSADVYSPFVGAMHIIFYLIMALIVIRLQETLKLK